MKNILSIILLLIFGAPNYISAEVNNTKEIPFDKITQGELVAIIG